MFYFSKILSIFTQPLIWAAMLFGLSLLLRWRSRHRAAARWLMLATLSWTALVGWLPLPEALLRELENHHPAPVAVAAGPLQAYTGVVVLGSSQERLTASVMLLRQHPHLRLLFTGGDGKWWASGPTEADQAEAFFKRVGVSAGGLCCGGISKFLRILALWRGRYLAAVGGTPVPSLRTTCGNPCSRFFSDGSPCWLRSACA